MRWFRFCMHKAYFDTGYGLTSYVKYGIALFGVSSLNVKITLILGLIYGVFCYLVGRIWFAWGFKIADTEVYNRFNLFVKEMRGQLKKRNI